MLELTKSSYFPAFKRLCEDVGKARVEANDNVRFLKPLDPYFQKLSFGDEFPALTELFRPIMHSVLLVWKHSRHTTRPVASSCWCGKSATISSRSRARSCRRRRSSTSSPPKRSRNCKPRCVSAARSRRSTSRTRAAPGQETPKNPWKFQNAALFARLDAFLERCHDILDLTKTVLQFNKLERVEVGGTRGKTLTASVQQIFADFQAAAEKFHSLEYDILDVEVKIRRRLSRVSPDGEGARASARVDHHQGFEDCSTVAMAFKLFDSFEGLLEREIITADLEKKEVELVRDFGADVAQVSKILNRKDAPAIAKNAPRTRARCGGCAGSPSASRSRSRRSRV